MKSASVRTSGVFWKSLLIVIFAAFIVGMSISFRMAGTLDGKLADRDYYEHGKHYDAIAAKERKATALGWRLHVTREADSIVVTVTGQNGALVSGGELRFFPVADGNAGGQLFHETSPGRYLLSNAAIGGSRQGRLLFSTAEAALATKISVIN